MPRNTTAHHAIPEDDPLLRERPTGEYLGNTSPGTLRNWRSKGVGPRYSKIGGRIVYRRSDLDKFVADSMVGTIDQAA